MKLITSLYSLAIFLGAFLLFALEPILAKQLLPIFGGSSAVWITCLVFFQVALFLGYAYAHAITRILPTFQQSLMHVLLLGASLFLLGVTVPAHPAALHAHPALSLFELLAAAAGLPFFMLASTSPLLQAWHARSFPGENLYRYYALSNAGSLLALALYPTVIEPFFSMPQQTEAWSAGYFAFTVLCGTIAWQRRRDAFNIIEAPDEPAERPSLRTRSLWLLLSACGAMLLCAVTGYLGQNIAAIPLLWIPPLAIYLVTFILAFARRGFYRRWLMLRLLALTVATLIHILYDPRTIYPVAITIPLLLASLFVACFFCHGELHELRPAPRYSTTFYLHIAAGGALGTLLIGVGAPMFLSGNYDFAITLAFLMGVAFVATWSAGWAWRGILAVAVAFCCMLVGKQARDASQNSLAQLRNFYGTLRVTQTYLPPEAQTTRTLYNGVIIHGTQFFAPELRHTPTTYYAPDSGVGLANSVVCDDHPCRIGVVGLGTGTMAAYGRAGDTIRFYEINPIIEPVVRHFFTYLSESPAHIDVVLGDARLTLDTQAPQHFDLLVIDAFAGDTVPVHLLTQQALEIYRRHLNADGILAFHISNHYLDLAPVVAQLARNANLAAVLVHTRDNDPKGEYSADWVLIAPNASVLREPVIFNATQPLPQQRGLRLWTDNYSSLVPILKWWQPR